MLLQRDAAYDESDEKQIARYPCLLSSLKHPTNPRVQVNLSCLWRLTLFLDSLIVLFLCRAAYCRNAIAISLSIKNNFHRYLPSQGDTNIVQYIIPYPMPAHMTTAAFSFSSTAVNMELESSTLNPQAIRAEEASASLLLLPPAIVQRVKRPYNKKSSQPRLLPPVHPNGVSSLAPQVGYSSQMSVLNQSVPVFPEHVYPAPIAPYAQPHPSLTVSEEATSDSGTDDEPCFKCDITTTIPTSESRILPSFDILIHFIIVISHIIFSFFFQVTTMTTSASVSRGRQLFANPRHSPAHQPNPSRNQKRGPTLVPSTLTLTPIYRLSLPSPHHSPLAYHTSPSLNPIKIKSNTNNINPSQTLRNILSIPNRLRSLALQVPQPITNSKNTTE